MAEQMTATVRLETEMRFDAEAGSGHHLTLDAAEHGGGHNEGFRPMELLLVGLAGCTGMDVMHIVTGHHIQSEAVARAIQLSEERYCGAGAMLGKVAHVTHTFRILEAAETQAITVADTRAMTAIVP